MRGQLSNRMASVLATQACGEQFERLTKNKNCHPTMREGWQMYCLLQTK